jgi:hypothetical protein
MPRKFFILANAIPYLIKVKLLLIVAVLFAIISKAQHSVNANRGDTADFVIFYDSSEIRINKNIADKQYWFKVLSEDTTLISFFKAEANNKPCFVYISSINRITGSLLQYEFLIFSRPLIIGSKDLLTFGYATYQVRLIPSVNMKDIISDIRFNGIVI